MFENCQGASEIKSEYRRLIFKFHPDLHASEFDKYNRLTQELNAAYHDALRGVDNTVSVGTDGKEHTYHYNATVEDDIIAVIDALIRAHLSDHARTSIVGIYVYVEGLTRNDRDDHAKLKSCGLRFNAEHAAWYWKPAWYKPRHSGRTLTEIKYVYGERAVDTDENHGIGG
ncbi:MAG: hypothetical protein WC426_14345 [Sulfuriferula sp.]